MATVYIWDNDLGHASIHLIGFNLSDPRTHFKGQECEFDMYFSFWPHNTLKANELIKDVECYLPSDINEDCDLCGEEPRHKLNIDFPMEKRLSPYDLYAMKDKLEKMAYNLAFKNCCGIVCECLTFLSGQKISALTPSHVYTETLRLQKKFGVPSILKEY